MNYYPFYVNLFSLKTKIGKVVKDLSQEMSNNSICKLVTKLGKF